jgi:hypothetical protein
VATLAAQLQPLWKVGSDLRSGTLQRNALADTSQALKEEALDQMAKVIGSDMTMRNYPRGNRGKLRKAGFGYTLHSNNTATLNFRPGGMWRIVEDGTSQHTIGGQGRVTNRGRRIGQRNESVVYKIGGQYRSGIRHVKGARPQGKPAAQTIKRLPPEWQKAFAKQYARYF